MWCISKSHDDFLVTVAIWLWHFLLHWWIAPLKLVKLCCRLIEPSVVISFTDNVFKHKLVALYIGILLQYVHTHIHCQAFARTILNQFREHRSWHCFSLCKEISVNNSRQLTFRRIYDSSVFADVPLKLFKYFIVQSAVGCLSSLQQDRISLLKTNVAINLVYIDAFTWVPNRSRKEYFDIFISIEYGHWLVRLQILQI